MTLTVLKNQTKHVIIFLIIIKLHLVTAVVASKFLDVTGKINYVCAIYRPKDLLVDDINMPNALTFCTCTKLTSYYVITVKECFVQTEWFISIIIKKFIKNDLPQGNQIRNIINYKLFTLIQLDTPLGIGSNALHANRPINTNSICYLYSFTTPNKYPFKQNNTFSRIGSWNMQGGVYEIEVMAQSWKNCKKLFTSTYLPARPIIKTTLCILPAEGEEFEPCSFDIGAPIICNQKLQGMLVDPRPLPQGVPNDFESECYRNVTLFLPYFAESFDEAYSEWVRKELLPPVRNKTCLFIANCILICFMEMLAFRMLIRVDCA